jgi:hypothetical protein
LPSSSMGKSAIPSPIITTYFIYRTFLLNNKTFLNIL